MNKFNEHQLRLWDNMIKFIDEYTENKINFSQLVSNLRGALQAGEFKGEELIKKWYEFWGALEIYNAVSLENGEIVKKEEVIKDIQKMRKYLEKVLHEQK